MYDICTSFLVMRRKIGNAFSHFTNMDCKAKLYVLLHKGAKKLKAGRKLYSVMTALHIFTGFRFFGGGLWPLLDCG